MNKISKISFLMAGVLTLSISLQAAPPEKDFLKKNTNSGIENAFPLPPGPPEDKDLKFTLFLSDGILNIKYPKPQDLINSEVIIYNILGKEVVRKRLDPDIINQVNLPAQASCYIVRINYSGKVHTQRIIVPGR